jgi:steroid 5-alpha reductase family enzyme
MDPLQLSQTILVACIAAAFFAGLLTRNYSHVDRLWSVLPPVYALVWLPGFAGNPRPGASSTLSGNTARPGAAKSTRQAPP